MPDARCNVMSRPDSDAFCDAGPCVTNTWLISQWGEVNELFFKVLVQLKVFLSLVFSKLWGWSCLPESNLHWRV